MGEIKKDAIKLLCDIEISLKRAMSVLKPLTKEFFVKEQAWPYQAIVSSMLTVVGEATNLLYKKHSDFCSKHPEIPFRKIICMRNVIIHEYGNIDWSVVWDTLNKDVPPLLEDISDIINNLKNERGDQDNSTEMPKNKNGNIENDTDKKMKIKKSSHAKFKMKT